MSDMSIICGKRVAVLNGPYKGYRLDGSPVPVERGEVGYVVGFKGIHIAIVVFEETSDDRGFVSSIPLQDLRAY